MTEVKRGSHVSTGFMRVLYSDGNGIGKRLFLRREENQRAWKNSSEQGEYQQPTQPTHATRPEPNEDQRALSPLDDSCSQMCTKIRQKWHLFSYCKDGHLWS